MLLAVLLLASCGGTAHATTLPAGLQRDDDVDRARQPDRGALRADGRVFVATKAGLVYTFDGIDDPTPTVFADLRAQVQDFWDRGLLGLAIAPDGRVFVAYSHDTGFGDTCPGARDRAARLQDRRRGSRGWTRPATRPC